MNDNERIERLERELHEIKIKLEEVSNESRGFDFSWFWILIPVLALAGWVVRGF
ncbi:hypothetical protein LQV63_14970 [Paenibacillus profundus]|uniref:Uncharacterized protein n=1 Tax=Paenibacillus profundus TaxID=1173085 RepID=A0ABS8YJW3_9BACL|nr:MULTISPECIES: hypothetical protein [Paenibacillus]MCE5170616.1 hypothetical protein [Paenibacillus profundus]